MDWKLGASASVPASLPVCVKNEVLSRLRCPDSSRRGHALTARRLRKRPQHAPPFTVAVRCTILGVSAGSSACESLATGFVSLALKVRQSDGKVDTHSFELSLAEFDVRPRPPHSRGVSSCQLDARLIFGVVPRSAPRGCAASAAAWRGHVPTRACGEGRRKRGVPLP